MKTIYYAIVQKMEVPDNMTDEEIDQKIFEMSPGSDYMWSEKDNLLD